jgi:hypothetical protein
LAAQLKRGHIGVAGSRISFPRLAVQPYGGLSWGICILSRDLYQPHGASIRLGGTSFRPLISDPLISFMVATDHRHDPDPPCVRRTN